MINSDRVTSSSDDLSHVITSSPPVASRRHGDADDDDVDDDDNGRNSLPSRLDHDEHQAVYDSLSNVLTHTQSQSQVSSVRCVDYSLLVT